MLSFLRKLKRKYLMYLRSKKYPYVSPKAALPKQMMVYEPLNFVMEEMTNIGMGAVIMNTRAKFIMKKYSGAAHHLYVITGNHMSIPGKTFKMVTDKDKDIFDTTHEYDQDVIVNEDVWLGANVTLLSGVNIGRGAVVGAGAVVRNNVPPYSIVCGNPAKVVGFRFTPNLTLLHEEELYPEDERLSEDVLVDNYNKYFVSKIKDIQNYLSL